MTGKAPRQADHPEPISETLFWLWDNGLIEWNGEYRKGRKVFVITEKGRTYDGPFEDDAPADRMALLQNRGGSSVER